MKHKRHFTGASGIVFSVCDEVWGAQRYANVTDDDRLVTCEKCKARTQKSTKDVSND